MHIATDATLSEVTKGNYCSGCGACATIANGSMTLNEYGEYIPANVIDNAITQSVCPFLRPDLNESALSDIFLNEASNTNDEIGKYSDIFAAHVIEGDYRRAGSSGGIGTWLGATLLKQGLIDGVIHVKPSQHNKPTDPFFRYAISRNYDDLVGGAHSHYHVVEMSEVIREVVATPGRYLFLGVPCFVKAIRRLQLVNPVLKERIVFCAALICGHMKSVNWSLSLGWGAGIKPTELSGISFRIKQDNIPAKSYYYGVKSFSDTEKRIVNAADITGGKFNFGAMMLNACDYCDDVVGETADITIGDAWLPRFSFDWRGKNMLVIRNPEITKLLLEASNNRLIALDAMTENEAIFAQSGGFRHRREGLKYRLNRKKAASQWVPEKRNFLTAKPSLLRRSVYYLRHKFAQDSREHFLTALKNDDWAIYERYMSPRFKLLRLAEVLSSLPRIIHVRLKRIIG